jgi:4-alpha-glucanotransferase
MRKSGILMHITSLPGPYGVGSMGKSAFEFVDFLHEAGQSLWQILPLSPTGYGDSPYQSCSTYAGNPYMIDLDTLVQQGLLERSDLEGYFWGDSAAKVDFKCQYDNRLQILRKAYARFQGSEVFDTFLRENSNWLPDYALFMALKGENEGKNWLQWEEKLKFRDPDAIWAARRRLADEIRFYSFVQFLFRQQWNALRSYAHEKGVSIIGDVPIYVPLDSCEVWSSPELFQLDEALQPVAVAGCPPDAFTEDGQLWGNPLYAWEKHRADGFGWWIQRLAAAGKLYDTVRLDHFRGFESFWSVPATDTTARGGKWVKGPGMDFIRTVQTQLPELQLIAEDLGYLTPEVLQLRDDSGLPGMKVLQFAFDSLGASEYLPHTYIANTVCYTGTHDNMTMQQWFDETDPKVVEYAVEYMALTKEEGYLWGTIRTAMSSVSRVCIVQMQDYLGLGGDARMNFPGTMGNWSWRATDGYITPDLAKKIYNMTRRYDRLGREIEIGEN